MAASGSRLWWPLVVPLGLLGCGYAPNPLLLAGTGSSTSGSETAETSGGETGDTSSTTSSTTASSTTQMSDPSQTDTSGETEACGPGELDCSCDAGQCDEGLVCEADVCVPGPLCGNGVVDDGEQCDDGNDLGADGCEPNCQLSEIVALAAGGNHTCALTEAGDLICWGANANGQLGYGNQDDIGDNEGPGTGGRVPLSEPVVAVSVGTAHTCALLESKTVTCWGANADGRLGLGHTDDIGDNETPDSLTPLDFGTPITSVSAGSNSTCVRSFGSRVYCWGSNENGQLGLAHTDPVGDDELVTAAETEAHVGNAAQVKVGSAHACAVMSSGGIRCWGQSIYGQLGYGNTTTIGDNEFPNTQAIIFSGDSISDLSLGTDHTLVLYAQGSPQVRGWGRNQYGQLGVSNTSTYGDGVGFPYAIATTQATGTAIAAGSHHTCALIDDGGIMCWGLNSNGQLGIGSTDTLGDDEPPHSVPSLSFSVPAIQVVAGSEHSCALLQNGDVHCWGSNDSGQIGLGLAGTIGDNELATQVEPVALF